jgi:hypothetical protein
MAPANAVQTVQTSQHDTAKSASGIRARMYRSLINDTKLRFINISEWDSGKALAEARANSERRASMHQCSTRNCITLGPGIYQPAIDVHPGDRV